MSDKPPGLRLTLPAEAENVTLVRHALAGLAESLGMGEDAIADLKTVVTEACMNVVVHAYPDGNGPLEVEAQPGERVLTVVVSDSGGGIRPRADVERSSLRLGLSLIAALSSSFEISGGLDRGTRITMRLPLGGNGAAGPASPPEIETIEQTEINVASPELLAPILSRVLGALAARQDLTIDRLSDAVLLGEAIAADAPAGFSDREIRVALADADGAVELRLGPMEAGSADRLRERLELPEVGGTLESLADEIASEEAEDGDYLRVRFVAGHRGGAKEG
jgi:anti-sigma regulatory factor (Ser/Thr protein kinase)